MAKLQIIALALIFFAVVGMAAASGPVEDPTSNDGPISFHNDGSSTGNAVDAAPVGGPVASEAFPDLTPADAPTSGAAAVFGATAVVGAVAAGVAGSVFF